MGYKTPNIDRIAKEGAMFTDSYAQQSCTAGRSSFILGQHPFRTGLLTIGMPGSDHGIPDWSPTIADLLKQQGYATGQFGKNHLGDQDKHLPTVHGFDEFYGNLYHLNAEEEPETYYYPKDPEFHKKYGPRGVIKSFVLRESSYAPQDRDVVLVDATYRPGILHHLTERLASNNIDIFHLFASAIDKNECLAVLNSSDNERTIELLNG